MYLKVDVFKLDNLLIKIFKSYRRIYIQVSDFQVQIFLWMVKLIRLSFFI